MLYYNKIISFLYQGVLSYHLRSRSILAHFACVCSKIFLLVKIQTVYNNQKSNILNIHEKPNISTLST